MKKTFYALTATLGMFAMSHAAIAAPKVVASIKPIHSMASSIMQGVGDVGLIVDGAASPHSFALKPSKAALLQEAELIIWVGHGLEAFLEKPIESIGTQARILELMDVDAMQTWPYREEIKEAGHDDHDHKHDHDHEDGDDPHIWLDPQNAKVIAQEIATNLIVLDAANEALYRENLARFLADIETLETELSTAMTPLQGKPFASFHDGYQYFERRFGLQSAGAIAINPEIAPSANHIADLQKHMAEENVSCVFSEPQFPSKLVAVVAEGLQVKTSQLDPLGANTPDGPAHYTAMMRSMATQFTDCLN